MMLLHIHESRFLKVASIVCAVLPTCPQGPGSVDGFGLPEVEIGALEGIVDGAHGEHDVVEFEVAAGSKLVECGLNHGQGFFETGY